MYKNLVPVPSMPPEDVRCAALSSQSLQVSWQPPPSSHSNGIIQGYKLYYEPVLAEAWRGVDEMEVSRRRPNSDSLLNVAYSSTPGSQDKRFDNGSHELETLR